MKGISQQSLFTEHTIIISGGKAANLASITNKYCDLELFCLTWGWGKLFFLKRRAGVWICFKLPPSTQGKGTSFREHDFIFLKEG